MTADGTQLPLPGLYAVDADGSFLASTSIGSVEQVLDMLGEPDDSHASEADARVVSKTVSIRVSGFMAAEGIT